MASRDEIQREKPGDYVRRIRNAKGWTLEDVERNSGGEISDAYVSRIENGYITNVSPAKQRALAKGLQRPYDEVRAVFDGAAANGSVAEDDDFEKSEIAALFYDSKSLSKEDQKDLQVIWDMLKADIRRRKQKARRT